MFRSIKKKIKQQKQQLGNIQTSEQNHLCETDLSEIKWID